jgi:hypothetical protein
MTTYYDVGLVNFCEFSRVLDLIRCPHKESKNIVDMRVPYSFTVAFLRHSDFLNSSSSATVSDHVRFDTAVDLTR